MSLKFGYNKKPIDSVEERVYLKDSNGQSIVSRLINVSLLGISYSGFDEVTFLYSIIS